MWITLWTWQDELSYWRWVIFPHHELISKECPSFAPARPSSSGLGQASVHFDIGSPNFSIRMVISLSVKGKRSRLYEIVSVRLSGCGYVAMCQAAHSFQAE